MAFELKIKSHLQFPAAVAVRIALRVRYESGQRCEMKLTNDAIGGLQAR